MEERFPQSTSPPLATTPFHKQDARRHQEAWAKHLDVPLNLQNSSGMKLALIPAGEFTMGSPAAESNRSKHEGPQHRVRITRPFYLGVYQVTQEEYEQVMETNPSAFSRDGGNSHVISSLDTRRFPVGRVSWDEAREFCRRLSEREEHEYRLPTEAEWEYACRAGTTTPFHFGDVLDGRQANADGRYCYGTEQQGPYLRRPTTVGSYSANAFDLHDMHGNVWEWCADWYDWNYYAHAPLEDPQGPATGTARVNRGGSWYSYARACRAAFRCELSPGMRFFDVGFRVASAWIIE